MSRRLPLASRLAVLDRTDLGAVLAKAAKRAELDFEVATYGSALELIGESGPTEIDGLAVHVGTAGPFLAEVLRWADQLKQRTPTSLFGTGDEAADDEAARQILGREQIQWLPAERTSVDLERWLLLVAEVRELRSFRREHDATAQTLRRARMALFHGHALEKPPDDGPPCGPPLPTRVEEIEPLKEARSRFERAHIQAVLRDRDSLKDASSALGISYTSLWRRLK
jgi:hypothetical protein